MLKKIIQISSLTGLLALAVILPAAASGSEEDAAVPAGSFTAAMATPARVGHGHCFHFDCHHARMGERMRHRLG